MKWLAHGKYIDRSSAPNYKTKITDDQAISIIMYPRPNVPTAKKFKVSESSVKAIRNGRMKKHLYEYRIKAPKYKSEVSR